MPDDATLADALIKLAERMEALSETLRDEKGREKTAASREAFEIGTVGNGIAAEADPLTSYLLS